jgi:hypothetical protein
MNGRRRVIITHCPTLARHLTNTARLREYFDMDVKDDMIAYYAKQGYYHPKNPSDLRIQLQTAYDMLELFTCKKSIATIGLVLIDCTPCIACFDTFLRFE